MSARCHCALIVSLSLGVAVPSYAAPFVVSEDGFAVVRTKGISPLSASSFDTSLLDPFPWQSTAASGGSFSVSTYEAQVNGSLRFLDPDRRIGGALLQGTYSNAAPAEPVLDFIQVVSSNQRLDGSFVSNNGREIILDNAARPNAPFYDLTTTLPGQISQPSDRVLFSDLPTRRWAERDPINAALGRANISKDVSIFWDAELYPVETNTLTPQAGASLVIRDGISWGFDIKKAPVGSTTGTLTDPLRTFPLPARVFVQGEGTDTLSYSDATVPISRNLSQSISFIGTDFDTEAGEEFQLGRLEFALLDDDEDFGEIGDLRQVTLNASFGFTNVPEFNMTVPIDIGLRAISGFDIGLDVIEVTLLDDGTKLIFDQESDLDTIGVDIMATLSTNLVEVEAFELAGIANASLNNTSITQFIADSFNVDIRGFSNPSQGFIVEVISPSTLSLFIISLSVLFYYNRRDAIS